MKDHCPKCDGLKKSRAKTCRSCMPRPQGCLGLKGKDHPSWKGGFQIDRKGYVRLYAPERKNRYVLEHISIMETHIGRKLLRSECVHHRNHNPTDNRLENLELMSLSQHSRLHVTAQTHKRDAHGRLSR